MNIRAKAAIISTATVGGVATVLLLNPSGEVTTALPESTSIVSSSTETATATTEATSEPTTAATEESTAATESTEAADTATTESTDAGSNDIATTAASGTYTGDSIMTKYGAMQVQATITDGVITDITWLELPSDHHSARINNSAAPALVEEALQAQSADVSSISGATYTSEAFKESLQSILDQVSLVS